VSSRANEEDHVQTYRGTLTGP